MTPSPQNSYHEVKMLSKSLSRLIDEAILPAVLLVGSKFLSVILIATLSNSAFNFTFGRFLFLLPSLSFSTFEAYIFSNSYSNLFTYAVLASGCAFILLRAHFFHSSHVTPTLAAKLVRLRLSSLVSDTFTIYHQAFVWFSFIWLFTIFLLIEAFLNILYPWIAIIGFLISLNMSWFLVSDVEEELEIWRRQHQE